MGTRLSLVHSRARCRCYRMAKAGGRGRERGRAISEQKKAMEPGCKVIQRQTGKQRASSRKSKIEYSIQRRGDKNAPENERMVCTEHYV